MTKPPVRTRRRIHYRKLIFYALGFAAMLAGLGGISLFFILRGMPDPSRFDERTINQSTKLYDRTGTIVLYDIFGKEKRTVVPFDKISTHLKQAVIAIEDANFYAHGGVDLKGILRALYANLTTRDFKQGGSTITQQLVKNSLLKPDRSIVRKIREAVIAIIIESRYSKDDILGFYLNQIPFGSNAYGAETAAETLFGKSADRLSLAESALLAALLKAPSYYSPYGTHVPEMLSRKDLVLDRMAKLDLISAAEAEQAKNEPIYFRKYKQNILAPHFVMYVREYLAEKYGEEYVERGGLKVTTTLDWNLQEKAETLIREGAERNEKLIDARNSGLVAMDPKTGEILAMAGSRDYFGDPSPQGCKPGVNCQFDPQVNMAVQRRQPGSAFKPFVYATAFNKGYTPETVLFDVPTEFNTACGADGAAPAGYDEKLCYMPGNYDEKFRGPVTARKSLAQSLNVPSVELLYLAGVKDSIETAERAGITTIDYDPSRYGLALVLGGAEVTLLDMAHAYGAFARDGIQVGRTPILKIEDADGKILENYVPKPAEALNPESARIVNDILSDNDARQPVFAPNSSLYFPNRQVAVKTGTTQDYRDAWTIGYTPSLVIGVWSGNNDNRPMKQKGSGVLASAPIMHSFMEYALENMPIEEFTKPIPLYAEKPILRGLWQGDREVILDALSGQLATADTPEELKQRIMTGTPHTILHWVKKDDPRGPPPENPLLDPQYLHWETAFQAWLKENPLPVISIPDGFDTLHTSPNKPRIYLIRPLPGDIIKQGTNIAVEVNLESKFSLETIEVYLNGKVEKSAVNPSSPFRTSIGTGDKEPGEWIIKARVIDQAKNKSEVEAPILIVSGP